MKEISLFDIKGFRIGHAQDKEAGTGLTVCLFDECSPAGVDIRGGGPASRETPLLLPTTMAQGIHALVLSGGSAFALDASGGVLQYLEERNIGFDTGVARVPLVCQSCIFDLAVGDSTVRPTREMAYQACLNAQQEFFEQGCIGAGMGASVGKVKGHQYAMKSGIGAFAYEHNGIQVGAVVVLNALGDIFDTSKNEKIAGVLTENKQDFDSANQVLLDKINIEENFFTVTNTTIGAVFTNAQFDKTSLTRVASITHNAYAKAISPVHTMFDGDSIYAVSVGKKKADINAVSLLATFAMEKAIANAIYFAKPMYGLISYSCL